MAKRAYHHGNLRVALIKAALKAIADEGLEGFTLRDVARRASVSAPAVYRHFQDKDDLLVAVAAECADRVNAVMAESLANAPADPLERFRAIGVAYVKFAVEHPEHFRVIGLAGLADRAPAELRAREEARRAAQLQALAEAQAAGQIAMLPIAELLLAGEAIVEGLACFIVQGRLGAVDSARAVELAVAMTRAIGAGFVPRPEALRDPRNGVVVPATENPSRTWYADDAPAPADVAPAGKTPAVANTAARAPRRAPAVRRPARARRPT